MSDTESIAESNADSFDVEFVAFKGNDGKLLKLFEKTKSDEIGGVIVTEADGMGFNVWASVLSLLKDEEKLFEIIKDVLQQLNRDQLSTKKLNDFYSRLCIAMPLFSLNFIIKLANFCETNIQFGDARACFFKDILPCILQILADDDRSITIDGVTTPSSEHHHRIIAEILSKSFKVSILTSIASMFREIPLTKQQTELLMGKICGKFSNVQSENIAGLAFACFNLALFNKLIIPVLSLDTYFYNRRYKKKFIEMGSDDLDSIDETAEKGIIESEENVIFYFQQVTEFTSIEKDIVNSLKPLAFAPKFILSPFITTVMVSFAKMSSAAAAGNLRLPQSILLPFIKRVFKNNEKHRAIRNHSAWARSVDQFEPVDIETLLQVIQENTCKLGQNVALNGFIGLTFMLLKTKGAPALNAFAVQFLNELVRKRQEFTGDIMKIVVKMLFSESNKAPIIDCFSIMIQNHGLPIDRCEEALTDLIENLTELELETALAIESVIYSAITKSMKLREVMTEVMRTAMYQAPKMRKLAVFSFCVMLKKVTKPNQADHREAFAGPSQMSISMMSLMSQSQLPSTEKANMRRVSVLVLEILGILRKVLSHSADIRITLYESLLHAVKANPFIIPNVLELVEAQFREYFDHEDLVINFTSAFKQSEHGELVVMDHLGKFLSFFIGCIEVANEKMVSSKNVQMENYEKIIEKLISKVQDVSLEQLDVFSLLDVKTSLTITQFLNCLEALIAHVSRDLTSNTNITRVTKLFAKHEKVTADAVKLQETSKKSTKKGKNQTAADPAPAVKIEISFECIWELKTCGSLLQIIFEENPNESVNEIKQNGKLLQFVLKATSQKILELMSAPEYLKIKYSKSVFNSLRIYSAILYQQLEMDRFEKLHDSFDAESAVGVTEAFKNAVTAMDVIYNTPAKWQSFLQSLTSSTDTETDRMIMAVIKTLQKIVDWLFDGEDDDFDKESRENLVINVFISIELLFKNFQKLPNKYTKEAYNWILNFCKSTELKQKNFHIVNRLFFQEMTQQDAGSGMMDHIARSISNIYGSLEEFEEPEDATQNDLKSIAIATVDQSFYHFANVIKKQIEEVDFCIARMNSFNAHIKIPGQDSRNESINALQSLEKSSVIKLTQLGKVVARLCNTRFQTRGSQIETIGKIVIGYFTCLNSLMKHFNGHFDVKNINLRAIPLEILMKETKSTVKHIYALGPHIEEMLLEDQEKLEKENKKVAQKEFKYMSRFVLTVETFGSTVQRFDVLAKKNFQKYTSTGDVRDFRIASKSKSKADARAATNSSDDESDDPASNFIVSSESEEEEPRRAPPKRPRRNQIESSSDEAPADSEESREVLQPVRQGGFAKNVKTIAAKNKKSSRQGASKRK